MILILSAVFVVLAVAALAALATSIFQRGIAHGRYLEQQDFYAEAINAGVGEFGADGEFRFKKP